MLVEITEPALEEWKNVAWTLSNEEVKRSDDHLSQALVATHKNNRMFQLFRERMLQWGSIVESINVTLRYKKLQQQCIKVCDLL